MLRAGDVLNGEYVIEALIGKGGMSSVFRARYVGADALPGADERYAIKEIPASARDAAGRPVAQNVSAQISLMKRIAHPGIARMVEAFSLEGSYYLVSEYVEGRSLQNVVYVEGAQDSDQVIRWGIQLCQALDYLHNLEPAVVYRDMKPSNVICAADGSLKLVDLGIAREYKDAASQDKDTIAFGTQGYAPPEQYGVEQTDARSDVYALGATLWHLAVGQAPGRMFPLPPACSVNPQVSSELSRVIERCTQLDRAQRYQSCAAVAAALERCQQGALTRAASRVAYALRSLTGEAASDGGEPVVAASSQDGAPRNYPMPQLESLPTATLAPASQYFATDAADQDFFFVIVQDDVQVTDPAAFAASSW